MTWQVDPAHSSIEFGVKHMVVASVKGRFQDFSADLTIDESDLARSSAVVRIDAASIDTRDSNRDGHLRSPDFFDVENHPQIVFESRAVEPRGGDYRISGDLTIAGVTRPVTLDAEVGGPMKDPWGNERIALSAEAKLNRKDFGLNWNAALEAGGFLVGDTVKLNVDLELVKVAVAVPA